MRENTRTLEQRGLAEATPLRRLLETLDDFNRDELTAKIRNRAQHGNHLPNYAAAMPRTVRANNAIVEELTFHLDIPGPNDARFCGIDLAPFVRPWGAQLAILESWTNEDSDYWMFGSGPMELVTVASAPAALQRIKSPKNLHRRHKMIEAIIQDIDALGGRVASHDVDDEILSVRWALPVLRGEEERVDLFRLGASPEWEDNDGYWRPFTHFLMDVLQWDTLLQRLEALASAGLERRLGKQLWLTPSFKPAMVALPNEVVQSATSADLIDRVVRAAETDNGGTIIVFIRGAAGSGKSVSMASCALDLTRRSQTAFAEKAVKPAALFVSSEGHLMANIDTAVSRVVDATPGLSASSVKVLAKHGLLVLFVDGLDELLGDASYLRATEMFNSWASGLGGRGAVVASARSSYFATAYVSSGVARDSQVSPELWQVEGLSDEQIQRVWQTTNGSSIRTQDLSPSSQAALRVPFLCFEAAREFSEDVGSEDAVRASLVDGYLDREVNLLQTDGGPLIDKATLRVFLREVAEMLLRSGDRSLSDDDLALAASVAGLEDGPILNRLRVMCGLKVEKNSAESPRFVFEHDFYFDHFHALAVLEALQSESRTSDPLLRARSIERWALAPIVSGMGETWCSDWLSDSYVGHDPVARLTRGNLLLELIDRSAAPDSAVDVAFGDESLCRWSGELSGVDAEVLEVGTGVSLVDGRVRCLVLADGASDVSIGATAVTSLRAGSDYLVGDEVRHYFSDSTDAQSAPIERNEVQKLLSELDRRHVRSPVVLEPGFLPDEDRMQWIDPDAWSTLREAAERSGVLELVKIQSRGSRNAYRTKFSRSFADLADREGDDPKVQAFWDAVVALS